MGNDPDAAWLRSAVASMNTFEALTPSDRRSAKRILRRVLGEAFEVKRREYGHSRLFCVMHRQWRQRFLVVPGGTFEMGLSENDLEQAVRLIDWTRLVARAVDDAKKAARPLRTVRIAPFLCSVSTLSPKAVERISGGAHRHDQFARRTVTAFLSHCPGFRLPAEAELEYLARDGGMNAFTCDGARRFVERGVWPRRSTWGFRNLTLGEWAADSWHPSYEGAPLDSEPWSDGGPPGVYRGLLPGGPDEATDMIRGLAALRGLAGPDDRFDSQCIRLARLL